MLFSLCRLETFQNKQLGWGEEGHAEAYTWGRGTALGIHSYPSPYHLGSKNTHSQLSLWMGTATSSDTALTTPWYSVLSRVFLYRGREEICVALKMCAVLHQQGWWADCREGTDPQCSSMRDNRSAIICPYSVWHISSLDKGYGEERGKKKYFLTKCLWWRMNYSAYLLQPPALEIHSALNSWSNLGRILSI